MTSNVAHISVLILCRCEIANASFLQTAHWDLNDKMSLDKSTQEELAFCSTLVVKKKNSASSQLCPHPALRLQDFKSDNSREKNKEKYRLSVFEI